MNSDREMARVARIAEKIGRKYMSGLPAEIQGAILCDLVASHLAGHRVPGDQTATQQMRDALLNALVDTVRQLVPVNEKEINQRYGLADPDETVQ